jgi:hydroxyacylglutathione hydrolase
MGQNSAGHLFTSGIERDVSGPDVTTIQVCCGFFKNYSYLVVDPRTRQAVLVDPAWEIDKIKRAILHADATLSAVLVTHAHPDHTDLAVTFAENHLCPIWASADAIEHLPRQKQHFQAIDGRRLQIGELFIEPIPTPGHTSGCVCYVIGNNLFSGDTLFAEGCGMCSDVATAHAMFHSLETLKSRLRPTTRIYPGHSYGVPTGQPFSAVLRENIYLQFNDREAFTAFRLRKGQNFARMFRFT